MPKGLRITVPIGSDQGTFTNVFVRLNNCRIYPSGQAIDAQAFAYKDETTFDTNPSDTLVISWIPSTMNNPGFTISDLNNRADVATFLYQKLLNKLENKTGAGTVVIVP